MKLYHTQHIESLEEKWWNQNPDRTVCEAHQYDGRFSFWNFGGIFIVVPLGQIPLLLPLYTIELFRRDADSPLDVRGVHLLQAPRDLGRQPDKSLLENQLLEEHVAVLLGPGRLLGHAGRAGDRGEEKSMRSSPLTLTLFTSYLFTKYLKTYYSGLLN